MKVRLNRSLVLLLAGLMMTPASAEVLDSKTQKVATTGDRTPRFNPFSIFTRPDINNQGQVVFQASYNATLFEPFGTGNYLYEPTDESLTELANTGDTAPNGEEYLAFGTNNGFFSELGYVSYGGMLLSFESITVFAGPDDYVPQVLGVHGGPAPTGYGNYDRIYGYSVNKNGKIGYYASTTGPKPGGYFVSDNGAAPVAYFGLGLIAPDVNGSIQAIGDTQLNNNDQLFFSGRLQNTANGDLDNGGLYIMEESFILPTQIAREGKAAPDGNGSYLRFFRPQFNDGGVTVYEAELIDTSGGDSDKYGLYMADSAGNQTKLHRGGEAVPNGGTFDRLWYPQLNNAGQVAFEATLSGVGPAGIDSEGLFLTNGHGVLTEIVRKFDTVPGSPGTLISEILSHTMNEAGQVAFTAMTNDDDKGLFLFDPNKGLMRVVVEGDTFPNFVGEIFGLNFGQVASNQTIGLNDHGDIAYAFRLIGGGSGIAVWDGPEPLPLGDLNGDGEVTNADIAAFVLALTDPSGYATGYSGVNPDFAGDFNRDGVFTNADIAGFVDLLTASPSLASSAGYAELASLAVPEPSSLAMLGLLTAGALSRRGARRRRSGGV